MCAETAFLKKSTYRGVDYRHSISRHSTRPIRISSSVECSSNYCCVYTYQTDLIISTVFNALSIYLTKYAYYNNKYKRSMVTEC